MARYFPSKLGIDPDDSQEEIWEDIQFNREPKADRHLPPLRFTFDDGEPSTSTAVVPGPSQERQEPPTRPFKKTTNPKLIKRRRCTTPPPNNNDTPAASTSSSIMEVEEVPKNTPEDSKTEDPDGPPARQRPRLHANEASASTSAGPAGLTRAQLEAEILLELRRRTVSDEMPPFEFDLPFDIVTDDEEEAEGDQPFVVGELESVTPAPPRRKRKPLSSDSENDPHCRRNKNKSVPCIYCHMWRHGIKAYRKKLRNAKSMLRIIKDMIKNRQDAMEKQ
ncbi:hypothetical protein B5X24_HaOG206565 [Helicoverpa armigera]|uniref:Uncharacterized protein n=1 Tax=Helicoverpa armigera TaxID=29058 RepID=A0A2W1BR23_HELAM|nr:hypothetical protein B5X24_HaOG206565 [Helicoverpa armigera]